jgi:serine protease Do
MIRLTAIAGVILSLGAMNCLEGAWAETGSPVGGWRGEEGVLHLAQSQSRETPASIYKNNIRGVFTIQSEHSLGSGFTFAAGLIATNAHVVGDSPIVEVEEQDGNRFRARVIKKDVERDFAILAPEGVRPFTTTVPLPLGNVPAIGEGIVVIGSPGGMKGTVTTGIVSQINADGTVRLNVAVNPGNSGGPVFDLEGRVFGIATKKYFGADGLGVAIPIRWLDR